MDWIGQIASTALVVGLFAWLRADIAALRKELIEQGRVLSDKIDQQGKVLRGMIDEQGKVLCGMIDEQGKVLRGMIDEQGKVLRGEITERGKEISALGKEVGTLREWMARMEGLLEGLREAVSGKQRPYNRREPERLASQGR